MRGGRGAGRGWSHRTSIGVALAAILLLAGCTSAGTGYEGPAELQENSDWGIVRGRVMTDELAPIPGAQVGLADTDIQNTTDESGAFELRQVPAGEYTLLVVGLGYESLAKPIVVTAGEVAQVDARLAPVDVEETPYHTTITLAGFLEWAMGAVVFVAPCSYPYRLVYGTAHDNGVNLTNYGLPEDIQDNRFWLNFTIQPGIEQLVAELSWEAASAAATEMQLFILCGDFDPVLNECTERIRYGSNASTSPVRVVVPAKEFQQGCPDSKFCIDNGPIWVANDAAMPFWNPQVAFQQRFEVWDTMFYVEEGPKGFSALPDQ